MKKKLLLGIAICLAQFGFAQLTIFSNLNLQGTSGNCVVRTIYIGSTIPNGLNNSIRSISLSQGFMATLAENEDGSGERFTYMAAKSNVNVNLSLAMQNKVSFIRVLKLPTQAIKKKGSGGTNNDEVALLNVSWFYDWGHTDFSTSTREFVPMAWGRNSAQDTRIDAVTLKDSVTQYLAFNEPDHDGQANMYVSETVPLFKKLLRAGYRMGSPACTESEFRGWLDSFNREITKQNMSFDFVCIHWYDWGNWLSSNNTNPNPTDVFNRFKSHIDAVWNLYHKPIWITEFNANINRLPAVHQGFMNLALPWLDNDPRIERYAYFFGKDIPARNTDGSISPTGEVYANHTSKDAYTENIYDTRSAFADTLLAAWEPSSFANGGIDVSSFAPKWLNNNITSVQGFTRGSGVDIPNNTVSNGYWGGLDFSTTTVAAGESSNRFLSFKLRSKNNKSVNYTSIDRFNIRINNTGPIKYEVDYQINNGAFLFGDTVASGIPRTTGNYSIGPINLSKIRGLQDIPPSSTVTFRIVPYDAASNTGTFLIGSGTADTIPDFTLRGSFSEDNLITVLPITLSKFQLTPNNQQILLQWKTETEVNFSHFVVEKSTNGTVFYDLATINGDNNINGSEYSYVDANNIQNGTVYYRLKMIDKDGSFKISNVLHYVNNGSNNGNTLLLNPTITNGNTIHASFKQANKFTQLKLMNAIGQTLKVYSLTNNENNVEIETISLQKGVYFVVLQNGNFIETKRFLKQ
jgi:Glycosyl hydrolase catalytic core